MVLDHHPRAWPAPCKHHRVVASGVDTGHAGWKGQLHSPTRDLLGCMDGIILVITGAWFSSQEWWVH